MLKLLKITVFVFLFFGLNPLTVTAQESYETLRDSIEKYTYVNPKKANLFVAKYLDKATAENSLEEQYLAYLYSYEVLLNNNALDEAYVEINKLIQFCEKNNLQSQHIEALFKKGFLLLKNANLNKEFKINERIECYTSVITIAEKINDVESQYWAKIWLALMKANAENYSEAITDFKVVLEEAKQNYEQINAIDKYYLFTELYYDLSYFYLKLKNPEQASFYNQLYLEHFKSSDLPSPRYNTNTFYHYYYKFKGEIHFLKDHYDLAEESYNKSISYKISSHSTLNDSIQYLGKVAYAKKDYEKAISIIKQYEQPNFDESVVDETFLNDTYKYLGLSYKATKNYKQANHYLEKYIASISHHNTYKDSVYEKFNRLEIENTKKELNDIKIVAHQKTNYIYYLLLLLGGLTAGITYYIQKLKQKNKQKFNQLLTKIECLKAENNSAKSHKTAPQNLKDSEIERILTALSKFEAKQGYLSTNCTLATTAKKLKTNTSYLSKVINSEYQKTFNTYITELRINYVVQRLKDDEVFRKYTILAIANEVGYKSKESFNKAFKASTGILPSYFIKQLEGNVQTAL